MKMQRIVASFSRFRVDEMKKVFEACQMEK